MPRSTINALARMVLATLPFAMATSSCGTNGKEDEAPVASSTSDDAQASHREAGIEEVKTSARTQANRFRGLTDDASLAGQVAVYKVQDVSVASGGSLGGPRFVAFILEGTIAIQVSFSGLTSRATKVEPALMDRFASKLMAPFKAYTPGIIIMTLAETVNMDDVKAQIAAVSGGLVKVTELDLTTLPEHQIAWRFARNTLKEEHFIIWLTCIDIPEAQVLFTKPNPAIRSDFTLVDLAAG